MGAVVATGSTTTTGTYFGWSTSMGTRTSLFGRAYINLAAAPGTADAFIEALNGGTFAFGIQLTTARQLLLQDSTFATKWTSATALAAGSWYRIEFSATASATTGAITVSLYAGDSSVPVETSGALTSLNTLAQFTALHFGWNNGHANQPQVGIEDVGVSTTGFLGRPRRSPQRCRAGSAACSAGRRGSSSGSSR